MTASEVRKKDSQAREADLIAAAHACLDREISAARTASTTGSIRVEVQVLDGRVNHSPVVNVKKVGK